MPAGSELARRAGLGPVQQGEVFYASLMRFAGCAATSHEVAAALGGDDIIVRSRGDLIDAARPLEALRFLAGLGSGVEKLRVLARAPRVAKIVQESARADCEVGADLAARLQLPAAVGRAVLCAFERFDGKGSPAGLAGDEVSEAARFAAVGFAAVMFDAVGGAELGGRDGGPLVGPRPRPVDRRDLPRGARGAVDDLEPGRRLGRGRGQRAAAAAACSGTTPIWTRLWPGSAMPLTSSRRSSRGTPRGVALLARAAASRGVLGVDPALVVPGRAGA